MAKRQLYRATRDGGVIDTTDGNLIYESLPNVPAREIAKAMNELDQEGVEEPWDWKLVEARLVKNGILEECRA